MPGDDDSEVKDAERQLCQAGVPLVSIELDSPAELGAELFKWELATALGCALLNVNPFDEPDVQTTKERAAEILDGLVATGQLPSRTVRVREKGVELYAEAETRHQTSRLSLSDAFRTFFELREADGCLAIITYLRGDPFVEAALGHLREQIAAWLGMPVLASAGPRYLHYFEQVYKGGPAKGLFLMLTSEPGRTNSFLVRDTRLGNHNLRWHLATSSRSKRVKSSSCAYILRRRQCRVWLRSNKPFNKRLGRHATPLVK